MGPANALPSPQRNYRTAFTARKVNFSFCILNNQLHSYKKYVSLNVKEILKMALKFWLSSPPTQENNRLKSITYSDRVARPTQDIAHCVSSSGAPSLTPTLVKNIQKAVKDGLKEENNNNAAFKRSLSIEKEQLEAKKKKLVIAWLDGQLTKEACDNLAQDFDKRLNEIDELCTKLNNYDSDLDKAVEQISDVALNIGEVYKSSIISEKHRILQLLLSNSVVDGKNLYFSTRKPFDKLLSSKGLNTW